MEEQECVQRVYNCSQGFLNLMKELFRHKTRPGTQKLAPYLQFISKSIICQFNLRSYNDSQQMVFIFFLLFEYYLITVFSGN